MTRTGASPRRLLLGGGALALAGALVGSGVAVATPASYTAVAESVVTMRTLSARPDTGLGWARTVAQTYASLATKSVVLGPVIEDLHLRTTVGRLAESVSVTTEQSTQLIRIEVTEPSGALAASIANAVQAGLASSVRDLSPTSAAGSGRDAAVRIVAVRRATAPAQPSAPDLALHLLGGTGAGLLLGLLVLAAIGIVTMPRRPPGSGLAARSML